MEFGGVIYLKGIIQVIHREIMKNYNIEFNPRMLLQSKNLLNNQVKRVGR